MADGEVAITTITERPIDSCIIKDGQIVHVEYLTERTTVEMVRQVEAQEQ